MTTELQYGDSSSSRVQDWWKEATVGLGRPFQRANSIKNVRNALGERFPQVLEKGDQILSHAERLWLMGGEDSDTKAKLEAPQRVFGLGNAFAVGAVILGRAGDALGRRTSLTRHLKVDDIDDEEDDEENDAVVIRVPHSIQTYVRRTFTIRVSRVAVARVAFVCSADAVGQLYEQIRDKKSRHLLAKLCMAGVQGQLGQNRVLQKSAPVIVSHVAGAAQLVHRGCQRWLGERITGQASSVLGRLGNHAAEFIVGQTAIGDADEEDVPGKKRHKDSSSQVIKDRKASECEILQGDEGPVVHVPLQHSDGSVSSAYLRPVEFRLIERNGFLEFEEPAYIPVKRRSWSISEGCLPHQGMDAPRKLEPFSIPINVFDDTVSPMGSPCIVTPGMGQPISVSEALELEASISPACDVSRGNIAVQDLVQSAANETRTTVQLKNVPKEFTREQFLMLLDNAGFFGRYCFVYLPMDFTYGLCVGYADVCLVEPADAVRMLTAFQGFCWRAASSGNLEAICETSWSDRQTVAEHVERYRDSPIMHPSVPEGRRPVLFKDGVQIAFPTPTKSVRRPRVRHLKA